MRKLDFLSAEKISERSRFVIHFGDLSIYLIFEMMLNKWIIRWFWVDVTKKAQLIRWFSIDVTTKSPLGGNIAERVNLWKIKVKQKISFDFKYVELSSLKVVGKCSNKLSCQGFPL